MVSKGRLRLTYSVRMQTLRRVCLKTKYDWSGSFVSVHMRENRRHVDRRQCLMRLKHFQLPRRVKPFWLYDLLLRAADNLMDQKAWLQDCTPVESACTKRLYLMWKARSDLFPKLLAVVSLLGLLGLWGYKDHWEQECHIRCHNPHPLRKTQKHCSLHLHRYGDTKLWPSSWKYRVAS